MNIEVRVFIWQWREIWREIKNSQSLLKSWNQLNSVRSVINILLDQERFLKLLDPRIWIILLSHTRNSRGLPFRMKIIRFFNFTIKAVILFVVTVLIYRMNNRNMVENKAFFLTGLLPTIPMNSIGPRNDTLGDSVGSSHINRFVVSLLCLPKGKKISESSFLNPKESTQESTPRTRTNRGLRWVRNWIEKKRNSILLKKVKESSDQDYIDSISELLDDQYFDSIRNGLLKPEIEEGKERSIFGDLAFLRAERESKGLAKCLSEDSSMARQLAESEKQMINDRLPEDVEINDRLPEDVEINDRLPEDVEINDRLPEDVEINDRLPEDVEINDRVPEDIEKLFGNPLRNPTRPLSSFFYDGWSELHMGSKPTERSTRDPKLLKKEQDLSFIRRAEHQELANLFKILMYLHNTVSIHPISSDAGWELEERFHEMADLFTLSITEPDLVYRKGFAFSMDSYGLDQKQFLNEVFNSGDEWKKKSLWVLLPSSFSDRNFEYGIQRDQIGKDTWFNPLILIYRTQRSMNRDPDAYRYKWSENFEPKNLFPVVFDRLKIDIIDAVSKAKRVWFEIRVQAKRVWFEIRVQAKRVWFEIRVQAKRVWFEIRVQAKRVWFEIIDAVSKAKRVWFEIIDAVSKFEISDAVSKAKRVWFEIIDAVSKAKRVWFEIRVQAKIVWFLIREIISDIIDGIKYTIKRVSKHVIVNVKDTYRKIKAELSGEEYKKDEVEISDAVSKKDGVEISDAVSKKDGVEISDAVSKKDGVEISDAVGGVEISDAVSKKDGVEISDAVGGVEISDAVGGVEISDAVDGDAFSKQVEKAFKKVMEGYMKYKRKKDGVDAVLKIDGVEISDAEVIETAWTIVNVLFIKLPGFFWPLGKRLFFFLFNSCNSLFLNLENAPFQPSAIYISELKGPTKRLKPFFGDDPEISQPSNFLSNGESLFKKIPKRRIDPFDPKKNRRKSFDNTESRFSTLFYDQDNWLNPVKPFHRSSLLSAFYKANRLRLLKNSHDFSFDCNKRFPFYVERVRSKNYDFFYGQFLNTFIGNKIFSLGVGKKKHAFWWRFWWRDTLSAIESEVSNIFSGDETDYLYKSSSRSDRAVYSIAGISGTPRTEGDVVNLEKTYCQPLSDMNLSDSKRKNLYNLYQSLNSNMELIHTLCSEKYVPSKKKNQPSLEDKRSLWLRKKAYQEKRIARSKTYKKKKALITRKKWKRFKTYLPWVFTLQGYRYLQTLLLQILLAEFRRLKTENKYVSGFLEIVSFFGDIIKIVVKRGRIIHFCVLKWKHKYPWIRKIRAKIRRILRKRSWIQRRHLHEYLLSQDLNPRNNEPPLKSTRLMSSAYLREFSYSTLFLLLVTGWLVYSNLLAIFYNCHMLQTDFKTLKFFLTEPSLIESEVQQLVDRYPLSESKSFKVELTKILQDTLQKMLFPNVYGIRLNRKKYLMAKLVELINLISLSMDRLTFWINTRYISHTSKEIYSALRTKRVWVDEKIAFWVENSEWVDDEERAVLMQFSTFTREKRIDQILWNLTDSDHFSKNEFDAQLIEQPGEIYLRRLIDLHNRGLLNYEFDTSSLAERRIFLGFYQTLTYAKTPSEANSGDVQKPFSLRLALAPSRGILVIGSIGLGRSYLVKYLTKHSNFPLITIFLDKFRDTIFRFDESEEDDDSYDSDLDDFEFFIDSREDIEAINQDIHLFDNMDIDIDPRANIWPEMDDHDYINVELEELSMMDGVVVEMDTVYDVAKFFISLQFELTKAMAPCIIWIPNIHELDFRDSGSFSLDLLVKLFSWDCERSSNNCERFSNRNSLVIASTHIPTEVHPALIAPHRLGTCIKIRRPLISQQQRHFFTLLTNRGFRLDKKAFRAKGFEAIHMGSHAQTVEALANEALSICISQGKSIVDETTIRLARHRQTWELRAHGIPVKNPRPVFYQIGRAIAQMLLLSNCPVEPISIFLQKTFVNAGDSYVYRSYYELGMSTKKLTILLYLLKCSAGSVAQELWAPPEQNENNRIAYGRLVEDDFDLLHGLLEIEGILEGFSPTEKDCSQTEKEGVSPTEQEEVSPTEQEEVSPTEQEEVSPTEQEEVSPTEKEEVSRTEQEEVSPTEKEEVSRTEQEEVSPTEKDCSQTEQDCSQTEQDCSQTEKDCSQFDKDRVRVLLRPEPRNPSEMLQVGFSSMVDKKFIYKSSDVYVGGLKVDPQKFFSDFIAWAPRIWSPWGFLFDSVERVTDNQLGFAYWSSSFWAKQMDIDIVGKDFSDEFDEDYQENDQEKDSEDKAKLNPNPLQKKYKKKKGLFYKLEDQDDGFESDFDTYNYVGKKFYEAFLRNVYKTRAKMIFSKEQVLFRVSQFIWHPGNPFVFLSDDPAFASIFSHREFFVETDRQVLKWYVTAEIKSMKKSWLLEEAKDMHFDRLTSRRRWLRRSDPALSKASKASFRSHTLSESFQYLSNLFLSNRTLVEQIKKTLVRKRWLFPDDLAKFFQNYFMEHSATAETRKD
uniref:Hypothetical chloroplast RF2 n=1 Tax=Monopsis alba TaxID=2041135 RepID=A0A291F0X2_9ASTR|nr:hypothetical chloroplast RF2 [Monopsis alba]YP_009435822.1 hypothetical chloroplast RF2 [Monopsis alba]ATG25800.1 hypothetical chloroplast RF2 [Monopsis alba]ATG25825.1 hypothetical chloroplast RF2 [Monopsis alba]